MRPGRAPVAGVLLTGGSSRRMGTDKASLRFGGVSAAARLGRLLEAVADPCVEVGPGRSGLPAMREEPPGEGPLVAVGAASDWLAAHGAGGAALVLACDLPLVNRAVLERLAGWPGEATVIPFIGGRDQPLCARWSAADLQRARVLAAAGERSLRWLG